jgi:hypothetical protein
VTTAALTEVPHAHYPATRPQGAAVKTTPAAAHQAHRRKAHQAYRRTANPRTRTRIKGTCGTSLHHNPCRPSNVEWRWPTRSGSSTAGQRDGASPRVPRLPRPQTGPTKSSRDPPQSPGRLTSLKGPRPQGNTTGHHHGKPYRGHKRLWPAMDMLTPRGRAPVRTNAGLHHPRLPTYTIPQPRVQPGPTPRPGPGRRPRRHPRRQSTQQAQQPWTLRQERHQGRPRRKTKAKRRSTLQIYASTPHAHRQLRSRHGPSLYLHYRRLTLGVRYALRGVTDSLVNELAPAAPATTPYCTARTASSDAYVSIAPKVVQTNAPS